MKYTLDTLPERFKKKVEIDSDAVKADLEARLNAPPTKRDSFVELSISEYDPLPIAEYEAFLERAKASGLDAIEMQINIGYYNDVESVLLVAVKAKP